MMGTSQWLNAARWGANRFDSRTSSNFLLLFFAGQEGAGGEKIVRLMMTEAVAQE